MKIRKQGWAIWDKNYKRFLSFNGMIIFSEKETAWLRAKKERKDSPYKVVKVNISIA